MATMASVPAQSLECAICHELYNEPKQLSCTHTFCKKCLDDLFDFSIKEDKITCPVCRQTTQVESGDVSKLQTNYPIKSLVEDIKATEKVCTASVHEQRSIAVGYCQTCGVFMCSTCIDIHGKWKQHAKHEVVDSKSIMDGKVKVKQLCKKHPQEEMEWACSTCKVSICFRCRMLYHNGPGHEVEEIAEFQKALQDEAKALKKEAEDKMMLIKARIELAEGERIKTCSILDEMKADVVKTLDESVEQLTKQTDELFQKLQESKEDLTGNLLEIKESDLKLLNGISSACDLMGKGVTGVLEGESLVVHQRLCQELRELVGRAGCYDENPRAITERAECIKFTRHLDPQQLKLGEINLQGGDIKAESANIPTPLTPTLNQKQWYLKKMNSFPLRGASIATMASSPDGKIAVAYWDRGVDMFTTDGLCSKELQGVTDFRFMKFLPDGRCVTGSDKGLTLYSSQFKEILSNKSWTFYGGTVVVEGNSTNDIVVLFAQEYSSISVKAAVLIKFEGQKQVSMEEHLGYKSFPFCPNVAIHTNHDSIWVLGYGSSVEVVEQQLDSQWKCIYKVKIEGSNLCPVFLEDDSILIGYVNHGCATVELYTEDLRFVRTVLQGFKLHGSDFMMRRFSTGEIAMCDSRYVHVFSCLKGDVKYKR